MRSRRRRERNPHRSGSNSLPGSNNHRRSSVDVDDVQYSSIHFQSAGGKFPRDTTVEESVQYAEVNIRRPPAAT
ncbi:hypothetical protein PHYPO_G00148040 [Pangasianodon hypophthalmus]|uniref:Uncharacterized protein n=1 Tax=Pangasianodon hypophthalmus TaxID=310915 RepID=A0A5N5K981_PANHP|nr:hypothetical protein PHYPO_G00148040 [Pangasianodon hypophthalmus]